MLIFLLIFLLISNAVTMRRDKSILFYRIVIKSLILIAFIAYNNLHLSSLSKGIALYGGLFNITTFAQTFNIFILLVSAVILTLTAFYPRKVTRTEHSSVFWSIFVFIFELNSVFIDLVYLNYFSSHKFNLSILELISIRLTMFYLKYKRLIIFIVFFYVAISIVVNLYNVIEDYIVYTSNNGSNFETSTNSNQMGNSNQGPNPPSHNNNVDPLLGHHSNSSNSVKEEFESSYFKDGQIEIGPRTVVNASSTKKELVDVKERLALFGKGAIKALEEAEPYSDKWYEKMNYLIELDSKRKAVVSILNSNFPPIRPNASISRDCFFQIELDKHFKKFIKDK